MRTSLAWLTLLGYAAISLGSVPREAHADSFSMVAGMQSGIGPICYSVLRTSGTVGVKKNTASSCFNQAFVMPVYWTTFPTGSQLRNITVRGRRQDSGSLMSCTLTVYSQNGVLQASNTADFPVTGNGYTNVTVGVARDLITVNSASFIRCQSIGTDTYLLKVDYTP